MADQKKKEKRISLSLNLDSETSEFYERIEQHGTSPSESKVTELTDQKSGSTRFCVTTNPYEKRIERHPEHGKGTVQIQYKTDDPHQPTIFKKKKKSIEEEYDISEL
jgi:hypothetical protein